MRCSKCGSYIDDNLNICPICGNVFTGEEQIENIQSEIGSRVGDIMKNGSVSMPGMDDGVEMNGGRMDAVDHAANVSDTIIFGEPDTVFTHVNQRDAGMGEDIFGEPDTVFTQVSQDEIKAAEIRAARGVDSDLVGSSFVRHGESLNENSFKTHTTHINVDEIRREEQRQKEMQKKNGSTQKKSQSQRIKEVPERSRRDTGYSSSRNKKQEKEPVNITLILSLIVVVLAIGFVAYMVLTGKYKKALGLEKETTTQGVVTEDHITSSLLENGIYTLPLEIKVESSEGNRIYYTLDGSEPNNSSLQYAGAIRIEDEDVVEDSKYFTLKIVTYTEASEKKGELSVPFSVKHGDIEPPVFSHVAGTYNTTQGITITAGRGTIIYYTYDGTTPTKDSEVYTGSVAMRKGTNTLSAIAVSGDRISQVTTATYTLELKPIYTYEDAAALIGAKFKGEGYKVRETAPKKPVKETETTTEPEDPSATTEPTEPEPETTIDPTKTAVLVNGGSFTSGETQYVVVEVIIYSSVGDIEDTQFYGVDDQTGIITKLYFNNGNLTVG